MEYFDYFGMSPLERDTMRTLVQELPPERFTMQFPLKPGDRVRIRDGYRGAGRVYYYIGKDNFDADAVVLSEEPLPSEKHPVAMLAEAIEPYPYTREERIERAIEDFECSFDIDYDNATEVAAALFAILDAGV